MKLARVDTQLVALIVLLTVGGILILSSASIVISQKNFGTVWGYTVRQLAFGGVLGLVMLMICQWIPYRTWKKFALPLMLLSFVLLALVFLPRIGLATGGARRWLLIGGFSFQPAEVLKFSFIIYLASWLDARRDTIKSISYGLIPFAMMMGIVAMFLVMQPDIGTLGIIIATAGVMYFLGGGRVSQIGGLAAFGLVILYFLIQAAPYRLARLAVFLNPSLDPQGVGYHVTQALIAIGSGGFSGLGFGKSLQKYSYLPEPMGDSVFAIFSEELGFVGVVLFLGVLCLLLWKIISIAKNAPDTFGTLLASGIGISIIMQGFINIAAISGLLPLTGIPLPFVSYGGTSLVFTLASMGVVLNISKYT